MFESALSPLSKEFCLYFYYLMLINLVVLVFVVASAVYGALFSKQKHVLMTSFYTLLPVFLSYFTNRLLYSMCKGSLQ